MKALSATATTAVAMVAVVAVVAVRRRRHSRQDAEPDSREAPVTFEGSVEVGCTAVEAFDLLVNTDRYATGPGSPVLRMERVPEAEARVGTRWREVIRLGLLGHLTVWSEIVALDPPSSLRLRFRLPGATGTLIYRIGPGVERETCIQQEQTFVLTGRFAGTRRWMVERMWKPRAVARLQDIRATLESRHAGPPNRPR
jgi:hypothetical protein